MRKIYLVMLLNLLSCFDLFAGEFSSNLTLSEFSQIVSFKENKNIIFSDDINASKISLSLPDLDEKNLFKKFIEIVKLNDFHVSSTDGIYYITKSVLNRSRFYFYTLKFNSSSDCIKMLDSMNVEYKFLKDSNSLVIFADSYKILKIKEYLSYIDKKQSQAILRIIIFEFSDDDVKERGVQYTSIYRNSSNLVQNAVNSILVPFSTSNLTLKSIDFYGAVRLLNQTKIINVKQFPFILAKNNKEFKFEAVNNIPYLVKSTKVDSTTNSETNSIEYKDVGLKINGVSTIYNDYISLNLDLIIEDLMSPTSDNITPQTYKRHLNSYSNLDFNNVLVLSGLKQFKKEVNEYSVPFLSNIPYLGELFKYKSTNFKKLNIVIAIEAYKPSNFNYDSVYDFDISNDDDNASLRALASDF